MAAQAAKLGDAFVLRWLKGECMGFDDNLDSDQEDEDRR
jgi:hypothetical protein